MAVQLNFAEAESNTAAATAARLNDALADTQSLDNIEFCQNQYWLPPGTEGWYQTRFVRRTQELSAVLIEGNGFGLVLLPVAAVLAALAYAVPPLRRVLAGRPPMNPLVAVDFARRSVSLRQNGETIRLPELGLASCITRHSEALLFSRKNLLVSLHVYDGQGKGHLLMELETAALGEASDPVFLQAIDALAERIAAKLNVRFYRDV